MNTKDKLTYFLGLKPNVPNNIVHKIVNLRNDNYNQILKKDPYDPHIRYILYQMNRQYSLFCKDLKN